LKTQIGAAHGAEDLEVIMLFAVASLALALVMAPAEDVKGRWEGKLIGQRPDGTTSEDTALLILDQKDSTVTGTIGGGENDQHPITSGTIDGKKLTIVAKHLRNEREFRLELTLEGDDMKGTLTSGERRAQIEVKRRK
jgi:hypothetical protein